VNAFIRAFRTPELRKKILFTLGLIAVYRLGVFIPTPGFNYTNVVACTAQTQAQQGGAGSVLGWSTPSPVVHCSSCPSSRSA
jgi:preprotein translocase subunit SecY